MEVFDKIFDDGLEYQAYIMEKHHELWHQVNSKEYEGTKNIYTDAVYIKDKNAKETQSERVLYVRKKP